MSVSFLLLLSDLEVGMPDHEDADWSVYSSADIRGVVEQCQEVASFLLSEKGPIILPNLSTAISTRLGAEPQLVTRAILTDRRLTVLADSTVTHNRTYGTQRDRVMQVLRQIGKPAHFRAVATLMRQTSPEDPDITDHNVHAILGRYVPNIFRRVALGTYGLAEWGLPFATDSVDFARQILEAEIRWMSLQDIAVKMRQAGWRYKENSIRTALDLEDGRTRRIIRRIVTPNGNRYGLAWWQRDA
jgi:hypothetical protein